MPVPLLAEVLTGGFSSIPHLSTLVKTAACLVVVYVMKVYFGGASNTSERTMHSKVIMITVGQTIAILLRFRWERALT